MHTIDKKFLPSTIKVVLALWCPPFLTEHWYTPPWLWVTLLIWRVEVAVRPSSSISSVIEINWTPFGTLQEKIKFIGASWSLVAVQVISNLSPNTAWSFRGSSSTTGGPSVYKILYYQVVQFLYHILLSLSTVVLNGRDRPGKVWLSDFLYF